MKRKTINNKNGYTLLELLLYMVIALMVIGFALHMTGNTQKQFYQQVQMSELQGNGRNAIYFIARDIHNLGFKNYLTDRSTNDVFVLERIKGVTVGEGIVGTAESDLDASSSFYLKDNTTPYDSLQFFKAVLDFGGSTGDSAFIDTVIRVYYYVKGTTLYRKQMGLENKFSAPQAGTNVWQDKDSMAIAEDVEAFQLEYSTDKVTWLDDPGNENRQNIKAIRISLLVRSSKTVNTSQSRTYTVGNTSVTVNDKYLRRLYTEIVEVENNGL